MKEREILPEDCQDDNKKEAAQSRVASFCCRLIVGVTVEPVLNL